MLPSGCRILPTLVLATALDPGPLKPRRTRGDTRHDGGEGRSGDVVARHGHEQRREASTYGSSYGEQGSTLIALAARQAATSRQSETASEPRSSSDDQACNERVWEAKQDQQRIRCRSQARRHC